MGCPAFFPSRRGTIVLALFTENPLVAGAEFGCRTFGFERAFLSFFLNGWTGDSPAFNRNIGLQACGPQKLGHVPTSASEYS
jgi:hypothetical protein